MRYVIVLALIVAVVGCKHYEVTDGEGNVYYTKKAKTDDEGAVHFTDAKSGEEMTLASASVRKIKGKEYRAAMKPAPDTSHGHWKVVDKTRLKVYYTNQPPIVTEWTTEFQDAVSGENIRLTSAEVTMISRAEFQTSVAEDKEAAAITRTISWD